MRKTFALVLAAVLATSAAARQGPDRPAQPPVFKSKVNAVLLDVRVVDRDGHFVRDLGKDDFEITEDGADQEVANFQLVDLPFKEHVTPTFGGKTVEPDVASNENSEGRLYVLLLDDLNMHPLRTRTAQALAREFVEHKITNDDRVVLTTTSGRSDLRLEFTNDRERLLAAIGKFQAGYGFSTDHAHSALVSLSALARWLSSVDGRRKTIVFISEGFDGAMPASWAPGDTTTGHLQANDRPSRDALDIAEIADTAARSNVTIYGIDPIGLPGGPAGSVKPGPWLVDDDVTSMRGYDRMTRNRSALAALSEVTGGFAAIRTNDFDQAFDRVVEESSSYYLIGYVSTNTAHDGKFRRISVRARRPDLTVRTRSGYTAPTDKPAKPNFIPKGWTPALLNVIQSPVQIAGLTMEVSVAPFRLAGKEAAVEVVVETRPAALAFASNTTKSQGSVALAIVVADSDGHVKASHQGDLDMNLQPAMREAVDEYGVRLLARLKLSPGHYAMKVGGADAVTTTTGSVFYTLDVPDFSKGPVALSGLLIASTSEFARPTSGPDTDWKARFDVPPTAARTFTRIDDLTVIDEVYNNEDKGTSIEVTTTVKNEADRNVFRRAETVTGRSTYARRDTIPLRDLDPGNYLLSVEARNTAKRNAPASRQVLFLVR